MVSVCVCTATTRRFIPTVRSCLIIISAQLYVSIVRRALQAWLYRTPQVFSNSSHGKKVKDIGSKNTVIYKHGTVKYSLTKTCQQKRHSPGLSSVPPDF